MARPETQYISVAREPVEGTCPSCGAQDLRRYPVIGESGWAMVTKCQTCLYSADRQPWNRLGPYTLLVDALT